METGLIRDYEARCAEEERRRAPNMSKRYRTPIELLNALQMTNEGSLFYDLLGLCKEAALFVQMAIDTEETKKKAQAQEEAEKQREVASRIVPSKSWSPPCVLTEDLAAGGGQGLGYSSKILETLKESRSSRIVDYGAYIALCHEPSLEEQETVINAILGELRPVMMLADHIENVRIICHSPGDAIIALWIRDALELGAPTVKTYPEERWTIGIRLSISIKDTMPAKLCDRAARYLLHEGRDGVCLNEVR